MLLDWTLALAPLVLIVVLMVAIRWGAARAGPAGWLAVVAVAVLRFGAGLDILAWSQLRALLLSIDVLLIVWGAFLLYRVADEAGAIRTLGQALPHLTSDRGMQALLIGWAFASFLQGVGGFGVPVVVTAPILVGLGFPPLAAVLAPAVGHSWSVTYGSLASSFQALIAATGLPGEAMAADAALLLALAGLGAGLLVAQIACGWRGVLRLAPALLVMAAVMGATQYALATRGVWTIAGFGAGMAGLAVGLALARVYRGTDGAPGAPPKPAQVATALSGYAVLVALTLLVALTPLRGLLDRAAVQVPFPALATASGFVTPADDGPRLALMRHAGTILGAASLAAYLIYRRAGCYRPGAARRILAATARGVAPSSLAIASMVSMSVVMSYAGMTDLLAQGLARGAGGLFPFVAPWIGALGAFITGSNTNSNLLFALLQRRTAELLGVSVTWILAAQTAGGAVGSVVSPTKVVVGVGSADHAVEEHTVMRHLLVYTGALIAALGLAAAAALAVGAR